MDILSVKKEQDLWTWLWLLDLEDQRLPAMAWNHELLWAWWKATSERKMMVMMITRYSGFFLMD